MVAYTVVKPDEFKNRLELSSAPVGVQVEKKGVDTSCVVECIPPVPESPLSVSDSCLENLLQDGVIDAKYETDLQEE